MFIKITTSFHFFSVAEPIHVSPALAPDFFSRLRLRVKKIGSGITQKISTPTDKPIFCPKNGKNRFTQYQKI